MTDDFQNFKLRLAPELYEELKIASIRSRRTLSEEIVARLEQTLGSDREAVAPGAATSKAPLAGKSSGGEVAELREQLNGLIAELRESGLLQKAGSRKRK